MEERMMSCLGWLLRSVQREQSGTMRSEGFVYPDSVLPGKEIETNRHNLVCTDADMDVGSGTGFITERVAGHLLLGHAGGVIGYTAMAFFSPGSQLGLILLRNETAFGNEKVLQAFAEKLPEEKPKSE